MVRCNPTEPGEWNDQDCSVICGGGTMTRTHIDEVCNEIEETRVCHSWPCIPRFFRETTPWD